MKVYAKNSFDRFGDDSTEEILQYLTLEDKIRLECVSKQWRRLIFNKQFDLDVNNSRLFRRLDRRTGSNEKSLEIILKKCSNIKKVSVAKEVLKDHLSIIGRNCQIIKSLNYYPSYISHEKSLSFFRIYGYKLEELVLNDLSYGTEQFLEFCPNLKKMKIFAVFLKSSILLNEDKEFLPKLENIQLLSIESSMVGKMKILADKYSKTMKTLNITLRGLTAKELKICIDRMCTIKNLKKLTITLSTTITGEVVDKYLSLIGQKCTKLLKLNLRIDHSVPISDRFFDIFSEFKSLKKLKINSLSKRELPGSIECFKHCEHLKELQMSSPELEEDFFTNIELFLPKLHILGFSTTMEFSDSFINSFHSMKNIQKVVYHNSQYVEKPHLKEWYFGKESTEVLATRKYVQVINDNCVFIENKM